MQPAGRPRNINPEELAPPRGFPHATIAGDTVWIGGQIGSDANGKIVEPGDVVAQFARAIHNTTHNGNLKIFHTRIGFLPDWHLRPDIFLNVVGHLLK